MKRTILGLVLLTACSDRYLDEADAGLAARGADDLGTLSREAQALSDRYLDAASKTRTVQDVAAFLTIAAAFSTVTGAVGEASDAVVASRALTGAAVNRGANRLAPKTAIQAIYKGARRLNCVATAAAIGEALAFSGPDNQAALAATKGSIDHIRILTREGLVRDVEDFDAVLTDLQNSVKAGVDPSRTLGASFAKSPAPQPGLKLDQYLKLLANCTGNEGTTVLGAVPAPS